MQLLTSKMKRNSRGCADWETRLSRVKHGTSMSDCITQERDRFASFVLSIDLAEMP
jgi:hypothetical protein